MRLLIALLAAACAHAAVVQGVVIDDETGNPLARTHVTLQPLPGEDVPPVSVRVTEHGGFVFLNVHPGWYMVRATRRGFLPAESGQKRAGRPGTALRIESQDASEFVQMRMYRLSAISGVALDDNGIGLPDITVHVFTAKQPVRHVGQGTTDDRGRFRVEGLNPGRYVVRSGETVLEDDTQLLPTWYRTGTNLVDAELVALRAAETFNDAAIRPVKGNLYRLSGRLIAPSNGPAKLTLITDTGRRVIATAGGPFVAENVPPGLIELVSEAPGCGSYDAYSLQRDMTVDVVCMPLRPLSVSFVSPDSRGPLKASYSSTAPYPMMARRVDLDGTGPERPLEPSRGLPPGRYEVRADVGPQHYVRYIASSYRFSGNIRNDDWFEVRLGTTGSLDVTVSAAPAAISGVVSAAGKPVAGAPVFLEWFNPEIRDSRLRLFAGRSDAAGNYVFNGLAPGRYRAVSSFDFDAEDQNAFDQAAVLEVKEGETRVQPLEIVMP